MTQVRQYIWRQAFLVDLMRKGILGPLPGGGRSSSSYDLDWDALIESAK